MLTNKQFKILVLSTKIFAFITFLFALPFYFGYGNPLPFSNQDYSFFDNMWLISFPIILIGFVLGLKYEKIAGFVILIPLVMSLLIGLLFLKQSLPGPMLVPLVIGILFLFIGYNKSK